MIFSSKSDASDSNSSETESRCRQDATERGCTARYCGVPVDDFRASFPLPGMTLSVVLGRTPWRATRESYTDCREYMPLPPFVNPRPAEDVPEAAGGPMQPSPHRAAAGCRSSAAAENAYFLTESGCESVGNIPTFSSGISCKKIFTTFCHQKAAPKCPQGTSVGIGRRFSLSGHARSTPFAHPDPGARTAVRSVPASGAMRRMLCASRNDDYSVASVRAGPRPAPIALLPLLSRCLIFLVLLDQAKSTRKN